MPRTRKPYPPEFRRQMVELASTGRYSTALPFRCSDTTHCRLKRSGPPFVTSRKPLRLDNV